MIKPTYTKYTKAIIDLLQIYKFKICDEKRVRLQLENLRKFLSTIVNVGERIDDIDEYPLLEWNADFILLNVVKPSAKQEIQALISKLNYCNYISKC